MVRPDPGERVVFSAACLATSQGRAGALVPGTVTGWRRQGAESLSSPGSAPSCDVSVLSHPERGTQLLLSPK